MHWSDPITTQHGQKVSWEFVREKLGDTKSGRVGQLRVLMELLQSNALPSR